MTDTNVIKLAQPGTFTDSLTEILRNGARALLTQAVETEVADFLGRYANLKTEAGRQRVVRHGHLPEREIMTGIGAVTVRQPRVRDRGAELALTCANLKAVGYVFDTGTLDKVTELVKELQDGVAKLEALLAEHGGGHSKLDHAKHLCKEVLPAMAAVRKTADTLEGIVADDLWPLATYQEMLFIM